MAQAKLIIESTFDYNPNTGASGLELDIIKNHLSSDELGRKLIYHALKEFFMLVQNDPKLEEFISDDKSPALREIFINLTIDPDIDN